MPPVPPVEAVHFKVNAVAVIELLTNPIGVLGGAGKVVTANAVLAFERLPAASVAFTVMLYLVFPVSPLRPKEVAVVVEPTKLLPE
jgi:hypothetical protein